jgi:hypothetical protein
MDYTVTRIRFADTATMQQASDVLGSETALIANICTADTASVAVQTKDKRAAIKLLGAAGLVPEDIGSSPADADEIAILSYASDAPALGHDWSDYDQSASLGM